MSSLFVCVTACAQISKLNEEKQALEDRCDELEGALKKRDEETRALRREVEALRRGGDAGDAPHTVRACCRLPALSWDWANHISPQL